MNQSFDDSNIDLDIDSLSEPMGFADGGEAEAMHLTPYVETNQESMDYQDAHSMPQMYADGGDVEIGDYSIPTFRDRTASQMLQAFADGGAVQGRPLGGAFNLVPGNPNITNLYQGVLGRDPDLGGGEYWQKRFGNEVDPGERELFRQAAQPEIAGRSGPPGLTAEEKFRSEPSYQQTTTASGQLKDLFGPATMLSGGTGTGANFVAPVVTSRPRTLVDVTPGLSASQQHARNLVQGDTALNDAFARTGLAKDPATYYNWQQKMTSGTTTPDQLKAQFDPMAYEIRVKEAYKNIGREGMGNDLSSFHPTSMGEMHKAYFNPNATEEEVAAINQQYSTGYGNNWNLATANKARTEVLIPGLQAQDYYKRNSDVAAAFATALKANPNQDYVGFAKNHYNTYGKKEGRAWNDKIGVGEFTAPKAEDFKTIDPGGYNYWMNQLKEGKISGADFDKLFYGATATYAGPYKDLYKESMDKANELIKARGLNIATGAKQNLPGVTGYQYPNQNALVDSINALYQTNLSRDAEPGGLTFWLNQFGADGKISPEEATLFKQAAQEERTARKMAQGGYVKKPEGAASYRMAAPVHLASGVTGGVSNVLKKFRFADGGEVDVKEDQAPTLEGADIPVSRSAKELEAYIQAMNPAVKTRTDDLGSGTRGNMLPSSPDTLNLNYRLTPGEREITTLHELEHSMDARGGDIYGRPKFAKLGGMDNNYRAYSLMGEDWRPITETVKNMVDNREKLEKFFGRPLDNAYFQKESYDALKKRGGTEAMFSEQLASLSALEQTTGKFLTQDPEMRNLFPSTKMMAVYDSLTGPRQTRMDARDLPPHTPVPSYTYEQNPAMRFIKKAITGENEYGSPRRPFPIKRADGSPETGEVAEAPEPRPNSAADTLKKLGLSVARGAPQIVTGAVDLAALPFTATGMIKPEDVVLSTEYLTKKGLLPPPQKGVANETMELLSSAVNPAGAVKGSAAMALGMMKNATGKTLAKQLDLPFEQAAKGPAESPMIRAYTGHTREIVGPYDVDRASRSADMGPGLYLTDDAEYASRSATKRVGRGIPESDAAPAVYPVDIEKSKILMHDKQYPREVLDKLRKFSGKVEDTPGATVSGEYIYEQIRKAEIPKTMMPGVFKLMGFQGAEFLPGGVSGGKSYVVYDTADTAKGAYTKKKFKDGGEATADFIKKSSKRR